MDLNEILYPGEKELLDLFFEGKCIIYKITENHDEETESVVCIVKIFDKYYHYEDLGKWGREEIDCWGDNLDTAGKREIFNTFLSSHEEVQLDSFLEVGKMTTFGDYHNHKILYMSDEEIYIWESGRQQEGKMEDVVMILIQNHRAGKLGSIKIGNPLTV